MTFPGLLFQHATGGWRLKIDNRGPTAIFSCRSGVSIMSLIPDTQNTKFSPKEVCKWKT